MLEASIKINRENEAVANLLNVLTKAETLNTLVEPDFSIYFNDLKSTIEKAKFRHVKVSITDLSLHRTIFSSDPYSDTNEIALFFGKLMYSFDKSSDFEKFNIHMVVRGYSFDFVPNSMSELSEVGTDLILSFVTLIGFAALLFLGLKIVLDQAISPLKAAIGNLNKLSTNQYDGFSIESQIDEIQQINLAIENLARSLSDLERSRKFLSAKILSTQDEERSNISKELHDEMGQKVAIIRLNTKFLEKILLNPPQAKQALFDIQQAIIDIDQELKNILNKLRSDFSYWNDHKKALKIFIIELIHEWEKIPDNKIQFDYCIELDEDKLSGSICLSIFRLTQEALTNIIKHAKSTHVNVRIIQDHDQIHWLIQDNGVGFERDINQVMRNGHGISGMQARVWAMGGDLLIDHQRDDFKGVTLQTSIFI